MDVLIVFECLDQDLIFRAVGQYAKFDLGIIGCYQKPAVARCKSAANLAPFLLPSNTVPAPTGTTYVVLPAWPGLNPGDS